MRARVLLICSLYVPVAAIAAQDGPAVPPTLRVGRYTSVAATPGASERDPLAAIVRIHMPRPEVRTVGDAIAYVLPRTGYRFSPEVLSVPDFADLLRQPLPESHRSLGPYSVLSVLQTLIGEGYRVRPHAPSRRIALEAAVDEAQAASPLTVQAPDAPTPSASAVQP